MVLLVVVTTPIFLPSTNVVVLYTLPESKGYSTFTSLITIPACLVTTKLAPKISPSSVLFTMYEKGVLVHIGKAVGLEPTSISFLLWAMFTVYSKNVSSQVAR